LLNPATAQRSSSRHRAGSRHDLTPLLPLLAAISLLALAVALITDEAAGRGILSIDVTIGRWLQRLEMPLGNTIAAFGNAAGSSSVGIPLAVGAAGLMAIARRWTDTLFLLGLLIARGLNAPLKDLASSPRPPAYALHVREVAEGLGFPSGHTMGVVLLAGGLGYVAFTALPRGRLRAIPCVVTPFVILATAYGRIETGAHWPTDVLGGLLWGTILLLTAIAVRIYVVTHPSLGSRR
jgi:membrane-associated phospholipid phosphatase